MKMSEKKRFAVETISTFAEVHVVFAENEEEAKKIAANSDYNTSFFEGAAMIDDEKFVVYTDLDGKIINEAMPKEYIG